MKQLVLHFGMHKTGSTAIQQSLYKSDLGPNWEYLDLGIPNHSGIIRSIFQKKLCRRQKILNISQCEFLRKKAKNRSLFESALKACQKENVIMSGEGTCRLTKDELFNLKETCLSLGFHTTTVGYLREPKGYIESSFQQGFKSLHELAFFEHLPYPNYRKTLTQFEEVFGNKNVSYWLYDKDRFIDRCVVKDFLSRLGVKPRQITTKQSNKAMSIYTFRFLYTYRKLGPALIPGKLVQQHNNLLFNKLRELEGPKLSLSKEIIDPIIESNWEDIAWANSKLENSFPFPQNTDGLPGCVGSESDLFDFDQKSIRWLAKLIDKSPSDYCGDPHQIATWVHTLHEKLIKNSP
ncbi:hypothetical protein [Candidatus Uabimicrobium amorphum]|uniref:Sulfotransferase domain-containing protein n=1 Tax=Uabimicrobium amorphum TaxID=2596890 RepID=A0A5S9F7Q7_UABAM|nr:hypothetical protein [Candidatus Uabimicrobium amorphum]BBM87492.1 hypothetical protein UABAM_05904 [Candidatus Uabimicrobium amorphum]